MRIAVGPRPEMQVADKASLRHPEPFRPERKEEDQ